jgi:primosomal protein N'
LEGGHKVDSKNSKINVKQLQNYGDKKALEILIAAQKKKSIDVIATMIEAKEAYAAAEAAERIEENMPPRKKGAAFYHELSRGERPKVKGKEIKDLVNAIYGEDTTATRRSFGRKYTDKKALYWSEKKGYYYVK